MARQNPPKLVNPHNAHLQAQLHALGIPSGRDRSLEAARQKRADTVALKPREVEGNIDDGSALENLLQREQDNGRIVNNTVRGGIYGKSYSHIALINANSPVVRFYTQSAADTTSTTNTGSTVGALAAVIPLGIGKKWTIVALASAGLTHNSGGVTAVSAEIDGNEGTVRTYSGTPSSGGSRAFADHTLIDVVGDRDVTCRVRYRSDTSGTTGAKNPQLILIAWRVE